MTDTPTPSSADTSSAGSSSLDVVGVGNALVDFASSADDAAVAALGLAKGSMSLVDEETSDRLMEHVAGAKAVSGGSVANTVAGVAALGGRAGFIARVADDTVGKLFTDDLRAAGVVFDPRPATGTGPGSGRVVVLISPDGERTMCTFLGAASDLRSSDIDAELIGRGKVTLLEGYLWDLPDAKAALRQAAHLAHDSGGRVALSLSDLFCVDRHRDSFRELIEADVDVLFANEAEILSLFEVGTLDEAVEATGRLGVTAALTLGAAGSVVVAGTETVRVPALPVPAVVDTTGAGDLYASGFLFGLTHGLSFERCAQLGSLAAGEIISHIGARPQVPLRQLAEQTLGWQLP